MSTVIGNGCAPTRRVDKILASSSSISFVARNVTVNGIAAANNSMTSVQQRRFLGSNGENGEESMRCLHTLRELQNRISDKKNGLPQELSAKLCRQYLDLDSSLARSNNITDEGELMNVTAIKRMFLQELVSNSGPNITSISEHVRNYTKVVKQTETNDNETKRSLLSSIRQLRHSCKPKYEELFETLLSEAEHSEGMHFLIKLREDLRQAIFFGQSSSSSTENYNAELREMDVNLKRMLSVWFSSGILELKRITYEETPAAVIEKIARKESVHPLTGLNDLKKRLGTHRRCFAFFHPSLPGEPLVFVHVALLPSIAQSMNEIDLLTDDVRDTVTQRSCAIFYSINSTQKGLSGVELGTLLIKNVCRMLKRDIPEIDTFSTLSPIPGFRKWMEQKLIHNKTTFVDPSLFTNMEREELTKLFKCQTEDMGHALISLFDNNIWTEGKFKQEEEEVLKGVLMGLAARYVAEEKHRGKPLCPVARFHCKNGAEIFRLNWKADLSRQGMQRSAGIMVNYLYRLDSIQENHIKYELYDSIKINDSVMKLIYHHHLKSNL